MNFKHSEFTIRKLSDLQLIEAALSLSEDGHRQLEKADVTFTFANQGESYNSEELREKAGALAVLERDSQLARNFVFTFSDGFIVGVSRKVLEPGISINLSDGWYDRLTINTTRPNDLYRIAWITIH